jgi:hypothetical protein
VLKASYTSGRTYLRPHILVYLRASGVRRKGSRPAYT